MRPIELEERDKYIDALYAPEDEGLHAVRDRLISADRWGVNIGANEGKILQVLIALSAAKKIVEIGSLFGYSAVWMARALPADGKLYTIERDAVCARMARQAFEECNLGDRVELLEGEADVKLAQLEAKAPFDLVFIDANKSAYVTYLGWALRNVKSGGLIVADNTLMGGKVAMSVKPASLSTRQWDEMRKFNQMIASDSRLVATILPTSEGLTVAYKR